MKFTYKIDSKGGGEVQKLFSRKLPNFNFILYMESNWNMPGIFESAKKADHD